MCTNTDAADFFDTPEDIKVYLSEAFARDNLQLIAIALGCVARAGDE